MILKFFKTKVFQTAVVEGDYPFYRRF